LKGWLTSVNADSLEQQQQEAAALVDRAERIGALAAALVGASAVEDVTGVLAEHLRVAVAGQTFSLRQVLPGGKVIRTIRVDGPPVGYRERFGEVDLATAGALREVVETGRPVFVACAQDNRLLYGARAAEQHAAAGIEGLVRLPLLVEDELLGVLSVGYREPQRFPAQERLFLTTVANLAAQALGRAMRTERLHAESERARRLGELAAALAGAVSVAEVGAVLAEHVQRAASAQAFSLREVDTEAGVSRMMRVGGDPIGYRERFGDVSLGIPSALAEAAISRRAVFIDSAEQARRRYGTAAAEHYEASQVEAMARFPLRVEGELAAILSVGYWTPRTFTEPERLFLTTVADLAAQALGRAARSERLRAEARRHRLISAALAAINRRLNPADQLRALSACVVPELADFSSVHVLAHPVPPGVMPQLPVITDRVASEMIPGVAPPPIRDGYVWSGGDPITETIRQGRLLTQPQTTPAVPDWATRADIAATIHGGLHHLVQAPVVVDGLVVAVASFGMCNDRPPWPAEDLAIIEAIAGYAATALEHGLSYQHTRETALVLQHAMLTPPPTVPGLELCARYLPAGHDEIGGDWYDAFQIGPGRLALAVGDVVGHDITAAAAMGQLRAALRTLAMQEDLDPGGVLDRLAEVNQCLHITRFATAVFARLTRTGPGWSLTLASAGHLPPVLLEPHAAPRPLTRPTGIALVPSATAPHRSTRLELTAPGTTVLLYTDGLVERRGVDLTDSIDELCRTAAELTGRPLDELCDRLLEHAPGTDDTALLALRLRPTPTTDPPAPGPGTGQSATQPRSSG
jgi:GAF domain-containing protein